MKMEFRLAALVIAIFTITACGKQKTGSATVDKVSEECTGQAVPNRYVVNYLDGTHEIMTAESDERLEKDFLQANQDRIAFTEHDFLVKINDDGVRAMDGIVTSSDNWGQSNASVASAWQQNVRGDGVIVAIVDTGMDINHALLRNQIAVNSGEIGTDAQGKDKSTNGVDDDGNGFIDDAYGFDFNKNKALTEDHQGHGTHVAGIIAGEHSDSQVKSGTPYVQGLAPKAKVLPLAFLDENGYGSMIDAVRAITYAVSRGAKVINASWGGEFCSRTLKDKISSLNEKGVIFVSAAGNEAVNIDRVKSYPASLDIAAQIAVGAISEHNIMAPYSNYGTHSVAIFAPGTSIVSTYPGGRLAAMTGTSMATPFVTGAVALLLSAEPTANVDQIRQALYNSSAKDQNYLNSSRGRLNLATAITELRRLMH